MHMPSELDVEVVRKEPSLIVIPCERSIALSALQCLVANNCCHNIIDSNAPALLPEDGDLTGMHSDPRPQNIQRKELYSGVFSILCTLSSQLGFPYNSYMYDPHIVLLA